MSYELSIALRYLKTKRHGLFAVLPTIIAIGGVTLGVAALIVNLSIMNGFRSDIQEKTLGIQPHILLLGTENENALEIESLSDKIRSLAEVEAVAPFIFGQTLIKSDHGTQGIVVRGIIPEKEFKVTGVRKTLVAGDWARLEPGRSKEKFVVLGIELAHTLGVNLGSRVLLFSPAESSALGVMGGIPKVESYRVGGIFQSGYYEYDSNLAILSLPNAQSLFSIRGASGIGVRTKNLDSATETAVKVAEVSGLKYWARSWQSMNKNLFEALKLEKVVMTIILTMTVLVASFTIISNLILMSIEKSRDIGILKALGASRASIKKIFLYAGMTLGIAGICLGTALGIALVEVLGKTKFIKLPQDVYYVDHLPVRLSAPDIASVVLAALLIILFASLYPATQASKVDPVDAIRYG